MTLNTDKMLLGGWRQCTASDIRPEVLDVVKKKIDELHPGVTIAEILQCGTQVVRGLNTMLFTRLSNAMHYVSVVWFDLGSYQLTYCEQYTGDPNAFTWPPK